jgi:hypothetical protein
MRHYWLLADVDSSDVLKLLGLIAAAVVLFFLAKKVGTGGGGETVSVPSGPPEAADADETSATIESDGPDPDQPGYSLPPEEENDTPAPRLSTSKLKTGTSPSLIWRRVHLTATPLPTI